MLRLHLTLLAVLTLTACPFDMTADDVATSDTNNDGTPTPTPTVCEQGVERMASCGVSAESIYFDGVCDAFDACESQCLLDATCNIFGSTRDENAYAVYETCRTRCYALGAGTCREAEMHVRLCGLETSVGWNPDRFCNATEQCLANCTLGTKCLGIWGVGLEAEMYQTCEARCLDAGLTTGALVTASTPHDFFCLTYPDADECADPITYCQNQPSDPWCTSMQYACLMDADAAGCDALLPHCATHGDEARCSPVWPPSSDYCTDYPSSPLCLDTVACDATPAPAGCSGWPTYCAGGSLDPYCTGAVLFADYCVAYPDSPECFGLLGDLCATYPEAPLCDPSYVPYCDQYPTDPSCQEPDYSQRYCEWYPDSPECSTVYEPYCVRYPWDPDCD